jgi:hypothetical protein
MGMRNFGKEVKVLATSGVYLPSMDKMTVFSPWRGISAIVLAGMLLTEQAGACCAVAPVGRSVVNADQSVIILWDEAQKTEHFIRQASFKSDTDEVGFLVPTPTRPQLEESGDAAFRSLSRITSPPPPRPRGGMGIPLGCSAPDGAMRGSVQVIEQKRVAGYDATVLTAANGKDLVEWLRTNGYSYSPAVEAWAHPYVTGGWMMVALKIAKPDAGEAMADLRTKSLRLSFKTEKPLFPYREPESTVAAKEVGARSRLLQIYFISDAPYAGYVGKDWWSGQNRWAGDITSHRKMLLRELGLPENTGPAKWWLTTYHDQWAYAKADSDLVFVRSKEPPVEVRGGYRAAAVSGMEEGVRYEYDMALMGFIGLALVRPWRRRESQ